MSIDNPQSAIDNPRSAIDNPQSAQLLAAYDESWSHPWESIASALAGVTDTMAAWQPPGYSAADQYPGDPPPGTILWYVAHLAHCLRHYADILRARTYDVPPTPYPTAVTFADLRIALDTAQRSLHETLRTIPDEELDRTLRPHLTLSAFIRMFTRHNAWHAGQIALVKRQFGSTPTTPDTAS